MSRYEAVAEEAGDCLILGPKGEVVVRLPVVTSHEGATICEFRLETDVSFEDALRLIRRELLQVFMGGCYDEPVLELVDLANSRWARVKRGEVPSEWTSTDEAWPPGVGRRSTALVGAPVDGALATSAATPFRLKVRVLAAAPDGSLAFVRQGQGAVYRIAFGEKPVEIGRFEGNVLALGYTPDGVLYARTVEGLRFLRDGGWQELDFEHKACGLSPDGRRIALGTEDGRVRILDANDGRELAAFQAETGATPQARWSKEGNTQHIWSIAFTGDGTRVVVGHTWPVIGIYDAETGRQTVRHEGTQHFLNHVFVAGERILVSLHMKTIDVLDARGGTVANLVNSSQYGVQSGGFARGGALAVTASNDAVARVWRVRDGACIGQHPCAKGEGIAVTEDAFYCRDPGQKALVRVALPAA